MKWKKSASLYIEDMNPESIFACDIIGDWDVSNERCLTYTLKNHLHVDKLVNELL